MGLIASANADVGIDLAWAALLAGGSALDAVEIGIRAVEDNPRIRKPVQGESTAIGAVHHWAACQFAEAS
jgi:isoaspartyl peptidase/L-asparaginase-like protein (Ntn-hydrolase superfamily)